MGTIAKRSVAVTATVAALAGASVAFAAWTSSGTGAGTATAGTAGSLVISQTATVTGLYPTGQVSVPFTVKNPNSYGVTLATAKASNFSVDSGHSTCVATAVSGVDQSLTDVVAAGATTAGKTMVIKMDNTAVDACQGATFTFDIKVNAASS